ncbi:MAG: hypothetical protein Kow0022_06520 [Phycisphaerales bacterium]
MFRIVTGVGLAACAATLASADRVNLLLYENQDNVSPALVDLWVDVIDMGSSVDFVFHNDSTDGVVSNIYFEQNDLIVNGVIAGQTGQVSLSTGGSPPHPAGSIVNFGGSWGGNLFQVSAVSPPPANGIGVGETLTVTFDLLGSYADVLAALQPGAADGFRIAQHVISFGPSSFWTTNVPAPGASALLAVGGLMMSRRRR